MLHRNVVQHVAAPWRSLVVGLFCTLASITATELVGQNNTSESAREEPVQNTNADTDTEKSILEHYPTEGAENQSQSDWSDSQPANPTPVTEINGVSDNSRPTDSNSERDYLQPDAPVTETNRPDHRQAARQYETAAQHYSRGEWQQASQILRQLVDRYPNTSSSTAAYFYLGETHFQQSHYSEAYDAFERFLNLAGQDANAPQALLRLGESAYRMGDIDRAIAHLEAFIQQLPENALAEYALAYLGEIRLERDEPQLAQRAYEAQIHKFPNSQLTDQCRMGLARSLQVTGDLRRAAQHFSEVADMRDSPLAAQAQFQLGVIAWSAEDLPEARRYMYELLETWPDSQWGDDALQMLIEIASRTGDDEQALRLVAQFEAEHPGSPFLKRVQQTAASTHYERQEYTAAADRYQQLIQGERVGETPDPLVPTWQYFLGLSEIGQGKFQSAFDTLDKIELATQSERSQTAIRHARARAEKGLIHQKVKTAEDLYQRQEWEKSKTQFDQLRQSPKAVDSTLVPWIHLRCAQSRGQLGQWDEASELAQTAIDLFPDFSDRYELEFICGRARAMNAEFDQARAYYRKVVDVAAKSDQALAAMAEWHIGETFFHQRQYAQAIESYQQVTARFDAPYWEAAALLQAGKCQEHLGNWKHAARLYHQLIQGYPTSQFRQQAEQRLARFAGQTQRAKLK